MEEEEAGEDLLEEVLEASLLSKSEPKEELDDDVEIQMKPSNIVFADENKVHSSEVKIEDSLADLNNEAFQLKEGNEYYEEKKVTTGKLYFLFLIQIGTFAFVVGISLFLIGLGFITYQSFASIIKFQTGNISIWKFIFYDMLLGVVFEVCSLACFVISFLLLRKLEVVFLDESNQLQFTSKSLLIPQIKFRKHGLPYQEIEDFCLVKKKTILNIFSKDENTDFVVQCIKNDNTKFTISYSGIKDIQLTLVTRLRNTLQVRLEKDTEKTE